MEMWILKTAFVFLHPPLPTYIEAYKVAVLYDKDFNKLGQTAARNFSKSLPLLMIRFTALAEGASFQKNSLLIKDCT
ncbi:hypothetical protein [Paenibacillus polymyxa]|uniref:hypothetical protein n=1 Tax=Paenibacillus polymyxa TaxID=1406 RepID=UPI00287FDB0F|nr:hypothetical protein [Paenibacillus polymyxa]